MLAALAFLLICSRRYFSALPVLCAIFFSRTRFKGTRGIRRDLFGRLLPSLLQGLGYSVDAVQITFDDLPNFKLGYASLCKLQDQKVLYQFARRIRAGLLLRL